MGENDFLSISDLACKWWPVFCKEEKPEEPKLVSGKEQGPAELVPVCNGYADVFTFSEFNGKEEEIIRALREAECIDRNGEIALNFESRREAFHDLLPLSSQEEEKIFAYLKQIHLEALDPLKYHQCLVERNEKLARRREVGQTRDEVEDIDDHLSLLTGNTPLSDDAFQRARELIFETARGANNQTDNWLLLEAARKCLFVYYHYKSAEKEQVDEYLILAQDFLESALAHKNTNMGFDVYKFLDENNEFCLENIWLKDNIPPIEGYFELKITLYELLSITDPLRARAIAKELKHELTNKRILSAQGSNLTSAQGYVNRLKMLELGQELYQRELDPARALHTARQIYRWAVEQEDTGRVHKIEHGLNRKDLVHDSLRAELLIGKVYLRQENYSQAVKAFQKALNAPESTRRYGGFLDIGIEALTYLVYIAVVTASSRKEAARKLSRFINWKAIDKNPDFKEALGLLVKAEEKGWLEELSKLTKAKPASLSEMRGYLGIEFSLPWILPHPEIEVLSELPLSKFDDQGKMTLLLSSLALSNVDGYMYARINNIWRSFEIVEAEVSKSPQPKKQLYKLGFTAPDLRPVLDREEIKKLLRPKEEKLDLKTLEAMVKALSEKPGLLAAAEIYKIAPEFFFYFTDNREYWNNASLLLSLYTEKIIQQGSEEEIEAAKALADQMLKKLNAALKREKEKPLEEQKIHEQDLIYSLARLQSCRAELISQFNNRPDRVYQEGIEIALLAISGFLSVKSEGPYSSKPDYFSIGKAVLTLGDLKVRLKEHKTAEQCFSSITEQGLNFNFTHRSRFSGNSILQSLYDLLNPATVISIQVSSGEIDQALEYNYGRNHITKKERAESRKSFHNLLIPISEIKTAGIYLSLNKVKEAKKILERVAPKIEKIIVENKNDKEKENEPYEYVVPLFAGTYATTLAIHPLSEAHELKKEIEKIDQLIPRVAKEVRDDSYILAFLYASKGEVFRALAADSVREEEISQCLVEAERAYEKIIEKHRALYIQGIIKSVEGFVLASSQKIPHSLTPELALQELARAKDLLKTTGSKPDYYFYQIRLLQGRILTSLIKWYEDQGLEPTYDQIMDILEDNIEESGLIAKFAEDSQSAFLTGKSVEVDDPLTEQEKLDKILYLTAYNLFSHISQEEEYLYASAMVERNLLIAQHPNAIEHYELDIEELDFAIKFAADQYQNYMLASALDAKAEALLVLADDQLLQAKSPAEREEALKLAREARALLKEAQYDVEPEKELYAKIGILSASILSRYLDEVEPAEIQEALLSLEGYQQYFEGDEYLWALAEFLQGELQIGLADKIKDPKTTDKYLKEAAAYLTLDGVPEKYRDLHAQAAVLRGTLIAREPDFVKVEKVEQAIDDIHLSLYRFKYGSHYSATGNAALGKLHAILANKVKYGHASKKCASYQGGLETAIEYMEIAKDQAEFYLAQFEEGKAYVYYAVLADYSEILLNFYFEKKKSSLALALPHLAEVEEMAAKIKPKPKPDETTNLSLIKAQLILANVYEEAAGINLSYRLVKRSGFYGNIFPIGPALKGKEEQVWQALKKAGYLEAGYSEADGITTLKFDGKRENFELGAPDFTRDDFNGTFTVESLCSSIKRSNYTSKKRDRIKFRSVDNTLERLNDLLQITNFYDDFWLNTHPRLEQTPEIKKLVKETKGYRDKPFSKLKPKQQRNVMRLNRLLIELSHRENAPKLDFYLTYTEEDRVFGILKRASSLAETFQLGKTAFSHRIAYDQSYATRMYETAYQFYGKVTGSVLLEEAARGFGVFYKLPPYFRYLRGLALVRKAGLLSAWPKKKSIVELESHIALVEKGRQELMLAQQHKLEILEETMLAPVKGKLLATGLMFILKAENEDEIKANDQPFFTLADITATDLSLSIGDRKIKDFADHYESNPQTYAFAAEQFKGGLSVESLSEAISADNYGIAFSQTDKTLERLNAYLESPELCDALVKNTALLLLKEKAKAYLAKLKVYDIRDAISKAVAEKYEDKPLSRLTKNQKEALARYEKLSTIASLIETTRRYRSKKFEDLTPAQQQNIRRLTRLLLELKYEQACPAALTLTEHLEQMQKDPEEGFLVKAQKTYSQITADAAVRREKIIAIFGAYDRAWQEFFLNPDEDRLLFKPNIEDDLKAKAGDQSKWDALLKLFGGNQRYHAEHLVVAAKVKELEVIIRGAYFVERDAANNKLTAEASKLIKEYEALAEALEPHNYFRYQIYLFLCILYLYRDDPGDLDKMFNVAIKISRYAQGLNEASAVYMQTYGELYQSTAILLLGLKESKKGFNLAGKHKGKSFPQQSIDLMRAGGRKTARAFMRIREFEKSIGDLQKYEEILLWDLNSLRAEAYHQQALSHSFLELTELQKYSTEAEGYKKMPRWLVGQFYHYLQETYRVCKLSRGSYDRTDRMEDLVVYFPAIPNAFGEDRYPIKDYSPSEYQIYMTARDFRFSDRAEADQKPIRTGWQYWRDRFIDKTTFLVKDYDPKDKPNQNLIFTERTGYGMFLATVVGDAETAIKLFEAIDKFSKNVKGLFAWVLDTAGNKLTAEKRFLILDNKGNKAPNYVLFHQDGKLKKGESPLQKINEFKGKYTIENLCQAINADFYPGLKPQKPDQTLDRLNEYLQTPAFYDSWFAGVLLPSLVTTRKIILSPDIEKLAEETKAYRGKTFDQLSDQEKQKIMLLNRLVLEATYPKKCPKMHIIDYSALDADIYMAYSLIKLGPLYYDQAQEVIDRIKENEISERGGKLIFEVSDGLWRKRGDGGIIYNPSYFAPYLLKTIAQFDRNAEPGYWQKVIDDNYELMFHILDKSSKIRQREAKGTNPMPDWAVCKVVGGEFECKTYEEQDTVVEMDAIRVMIEIGRDAIINKDPRAIKFLQEFLKKSGFYKKDGTPDDNFINRVNIRRHDSNRILAIAVYAVAVKGAGAPAGSLETFKKALDHSFTARPEDPNQGYFGHPANAKQNAIDADQYYKQSLMLMCRMLLGEK